MWRRRNLYKKRQLLCSVCMRVPTVHLSALRSVHNNKLSPLSRECVEQTKANRNCLSVFVHSFPLSPSSAARSAPDWLGWGISKSSSSLTHVCSLADSIHHTQGNIAFHLSGRCLISIRFLLAVCCWRWNDVTPLVTHTHGYMKTRVGRWDIHHVISRRLGHPSQCGGGRLDRYRTTPIEDSLLGQIITTIIIVDC